MSSRKPADDRGTGAPFAEPAAATPGARLRSVPDPIEVGAGTAVLLDGELELGAGPAAERVLLRLGGVERAVDAFGMPEAGSYRPGPLWWCLLPIPAGTPEGARPLALIVVRAGERLELDLGEIVLRAGGGAPATPGPAAAEPAAKRPLIAVCMATYEPRADHLARQLDSIRAQDWPSWICVISDDCSSEARFAELERQVGGDPRFVLSRAPERLGFYRNFERAMRLAPSAAGLLALCDQDDRWDPDKLSALHGTLRSAPGALLAYSDSRIADDQGRILSETFWYLRRNSHRDLASLLVANTVTGAASLLRRELVELALPLPSAHPAQRPYHDHWLALCALSVGEIAYLDRPTYDYTRHLDSITVREQQGWLAPPQNRSERLRLTWWRLTRRLRIMLEGGPGWRAIYFERYLLIRQLAMVLELRAGGRITPRKRRDLRRLSEAERSPTAAAWLLLRSLRPLLGRNETLGRERVLFGGLLWRWIVGRRSRPSL